MKKIIATTLLVTTVLSSLALAHTGATGVVKERMDMMSDVAKSMKIIGQMIKGQVTYNPQDVQSAALNIEKHAKHFPMLFPEGSTQEPSEALPIVWENWEEFKKQLSVMEAKSSKLAELAPSTKTADDIKAQFLLVGKTCGTCHETFRLKK